MRSRSRRPLPKACSPCACRSQSARSGRRLRSKARSAMPKNFCAPELGGKAMPRIERYRFGHVVVDGEEQTRDVVVLPERLVVGTGAYGRMRPEPETLAELRQRGVEVEALPTDEAVRRYGELDPRRTAAALHLTC